LPTRQPSIPDLVRLAVALGERELAADVTATLEADAETAAVPANQHQIVRLITRRTPSMPAHACRDIADLQWPSGCSVTLLRRPPADPLVPGGLP
jgi:hypothetical protein